MLQIIALLRGVSAYNARNLAEHFGTSRRNIYRDLAVLELAGVPFYYDPAYGEGGGYRIRPEWWFPTVGLTEQECLDLSILVRAAENHSIPLLHEATEVRDKLLSTLPGKQQDLIRTAAELFEILSVGIHEHGHSREVMTTLQGALLQRRQVEGVYRSPHRPRAEKLRLQPRRVFLCASAWYVAAYENRSRQTKLYRLARFKSLRLLSRPATVDRTFSLREFLGNAWSVYRGERDWHVEVRFDPEAADRVAETRWHHTQELEREAGGGLIFRATVSGLEEVRWWVLGWGPHATVVKPKELADQVQELCRSTLDNYAASSSGQ